MPTTYNGIGTRYYGKKNLERRPAACPQCGRAVELSSYDTRLWFVILFIPVLPLGRKRIVDYCPACTRHVVLELGKWEAAKQQEISSALEKYRANPTPEAAIQTHQQLMKFHQSAQAAEFRQLLLQKFADNALVQAHLGAALTHLGKLDEATPCYARALELQPDLIEARVGVAHSLIRTQRLDDARKLLGFLEKAGAAQQYSLEPLERLAVAYQQAGRHAEALALFGKLKDALPAIADHGIFRKWVTKSEKALGRTHSILPKRRFSWRRFFGRDGQARPAAGGPHLTWRSLAVAGVIVVLIFIGLLVANEYTRRHRTLYIVNASEGPTTVEVRGVGTVTALRGVTELVLPEGRHHARLTGTVPAEAEFEVRSDYFDRWGDDPAWVLNIGGSALLMLVESVYSKNPRLGSVSFRFGETFEYFPKVTHPFQALPQSVRLKENEERVLTQLEVFRGDLAQVFDYFQRQGQMDQTLRFAEWHLRGQGDDEEILRLYVAGAARQRQVERAENFLRVGLTNRPIAVEWHRAYQSLRHDRQRNEQLAGAYEAMLRTEPTNSALLYLRGRVAPDHAEGRRWFQRAREADPANPYPLYALGYERAATGDWAGARTLLADAARLRPNDQSFRHWLTLARLALGEFSDLEQELRDRLQRDPLNYLSTLQLSDVLLAQNKTNESQLTVSAFERAATRRLNEGAREINQALRYHLLYAAGDFVELEKLAAADRSPVGRRSHFCALLEQGRVAEAVKVDPSAAADAPDPFHLLTMAVAWRQAGQSGEAERWQERALTALEKGDEDFVRAAALLRRVAPPTSAELDDVILPVDSKALLLVALAQKHPSERAALAAAARRLNVRREFPYHFIQRVAAP